MSDFKFKGKSRLYKIAAMQKSILLDRFNDLRGFDCSVSVDNTSENAILVGCKEIDIQKLVVGEGMKPVYIAPPYVANTQMSLNSSMAVNLIKALQAFVDACEEESVFEDDDDGTTLILPTATASEPTSLGIHEALTELPPSCSSEITEYIVGLSKLYNRCHEEALGQGTESEEAKDTARSLFAQTVKQFNLPT